MLIKMYNPTKEVTFKGPKPVFAILAKLDLSREAHLVISGDELLPDDAVVPDDGEIEIRSVISGGSS